MRCFYCKKISLGEIELDNSEITHIFNVLRLKENEEILLNDCKGTLATAKIADNKKIIPIEVRKIPEPETKVFLFVSPPRKQQLDQIITQCCEVGVWSMNLIKTERSVSIPEGKNEKIERWQTRIIEACKQSHNPYAPEIFPLITFDEALKKVKNANLTAFFGSTGKERKISGYSNCKEAAWFVGPEGGFSQKEQSSMIENNFIPLPLGNWIMRVETAAVIGAAFLQKMFGHCIPSTP